MITREIANGDGDASDGGEAKIIEGVEVADDRGERRIPIDDGVFRLRRCCNVSIHLSPSLSLSLSTESVLSTTSRQGLLSLKVPDLCFGSKAFMGFFRVIDNNWAHSIHGPTFSRPNLRYHFTFCFN